jgi:hypothetical protein
MNIDWLLLSSIPAFFYLIAMAHDEEEMAGLFAAATVVFLLSAVLDTR